MYNIDITPILVRQIISTGTGITSPDKKFNPHFDFPWIHSFTSSLRKRHTLPTLIAGSLPSLAIDRIVSGSRRKYFATSSTVHKGWVSCETPVAGVPARMVSSCGEFFILIILCSTHETCLKQTGIGAKMTYASSNFPVHSIPFPGWTLCVYGYLYLLMCQYICLYLYK